MSVYHKNHINKTHYKKINNRKSRAKVEIPLEQGMIRRRVCDVDGTFLGYISIPVSDWAKQLVV